MKKNNITALIFVNLFLILVLCFIFGKNKIKFLEFEYNISFTGMFKSNPLKEKLYIHYPEDYTPKKEIQKLIKSFKDNGVSVKDCSNNPNARANLNLYIAKDKLNLEQNINTDAINVLWLPYVDNNDNPEIFEDFDVVVVRSFTSYFHLKSINMRSAFIPRAIDMPNISDIPLNNKIMFWGDFEDKFSLSIHLTKELDIDIYGKNWNQTIFDKKHKGNTIDKEIITPYNLVMLDQKDEEFEQNLINDKIFEVIEMGGIPFIAHNSGIERIFGNNSIPMFNNESSFLSYYNRLKNDKQEIKRIRNSMYNISKQWNSNAVALKFIEIFDIMKKKRI